MVCLKFELVYISLSLMDFRVIYYRAWVSFINLAAFPYDLLYVAQCQVCRH